MDSDTVNRELSIARQEIGWWQRQGWIEGAQSSAGASEGVVVRLAAEAPSTGPRWRAGAHVR
ncbi:hypothetical protein ACFW7J_24135 [Streptomyces sp. NPDC059525]|uniref:hypothetical protein n=1 Tax=Streptomyces sp. NPDC059525 TaxID=3346857 RepID=UPI0036B77928